MYAEFIIPKKKKVETITKDGINYHYAKYGSETHGKESFILWISSKLIDNETNNLIYPVKAQLVKGEKNLILKPGDYWTFEAYVGAGFRGSSYMEILDPKDAVALKYKIYHSPLGNLGISEGMLILTKEFPVLFKTDITGRTYGKPKNYTVLVREDLKFTIIPSEDISDLQNLLDS